MAGFEPEDGSSTLSAGANLMGIGRLAALTLVVPDKIGAGGVKRVRFS